MNINLNDCKPGDICITEEGFYYSESLKHPEDIMEILTIVDLSTCKPGDKLRLRNGKTATFIKEEFSGCPYPYKVEHENGETDVYTRDGSIWRHDTSNPLDIVEIIPNHKEEIMAKPIDPKNAPRGTIAVKEITPCSCEGCLYHQITHECDDRPCSYSERPDRQNVIFVSVPDIERYDAILRQAEAIRTLRDLAPLEVDTKEVSYIRMRLAKIDPVSDFAKTVLATYNQDLQAAAQKALDTLRAHYQAIADGKA